ncbi:MAG: phosphoribosylanthranilate isomerase [Deltaproteobacteria bacterium]|nr:phosphoribosylanthranilate isomerase [Deltaproteobacteria bacterium]
MFKVKICGITNAADAEAAVEAGADALGFVFYAKSPRFISPEDAGRIPAKLPPFITSVGVFVNETLDVINATVKAARLTCVQLHGDEAPEFCAEAAQITGCSVIKAFRVSTTDAILKLDGYKNCASAFLLDSFSKDARGGTGKTFDWKIAVEAKKFGRIILSGGLNPENVGAAIRVVAPYAVDVSSGVEASPGVKDRAKIKEFVMTVKRMS